MSLSRNDSSTAFLSHCWTCQPAGGLLGDAQLAAVEPVERGLDRLADRRRGSHGEAFAVLPGGIDSRGEFSVGHDPSTAAGSSKSAAP